MNSETKQAVAAVVAAAIRTVEAAAHVYDTVGLYPAVQLARCRRGFWGLGKQLVGDTNTSDLDRRDIDLMLAMITQKVGSLDLRADAIFRRSRQAMGRPAPKPAKPLASRDDIGLCLALDANALNRATVELAMNAANLDLAVEWAEEGDAKADYAIATRLSIDTHSPPTIALGAPCVAVRVLVKELPALSDTYDAGFEIAASSILRNHAIARGTAEIRSGYPVLETEPSIVARDLADTALSAAAEVNAHRNGSFGPMMRAIVDSASITAGLAAETAEAYEAARKAMRL